MIEVIRVPKPPIASEIRSRIIELIGEGMPRNAIAREVMVAPSTVSKVAAEEGITFERANQTASATAARQHDLKVRRIELIEEFYSKAIDHVVAIDQEFMLHNIGGKDNTYTGQKIDRPPTGDILNLHRAASLALKDARELIRDDDDQGVAEAESMLMNLILELGLHEDE